MFLSDETAARLPADFFQRLRDFWRRNAGATCQTCSHPLIDHCQMMLRVVGVDAVRSREGFVLGYRRGPDAGREVTFPCSSCRCETFMGSLYEGVLDRLLEAGVGSAGGGRDERGGAERPRDRVVDLTSEKDPR